MDDAYRFSVRDDTNFRIEPVQNFDEYTIAVTLQYDHSFASDIESGEVVKCVFDKVVTVSDEYGSDISQDGIFINSEEEIELKVFAAYGGANIFVIVDSMAIQNYQILFTNLSENLTIHGGLGIDNYIRAVGDGSFTILIVPPIQMDGD